MSVFGLFKQIIWLLLTSQTENVHKKSKCRKQNNHFCLIKEVLEECFNVQLTEKNTGYIEEKVKLYLKSLPAPKLSNSTTVETAREDTDKSSFQVNAYVERDSTDASDDYEYQQSRTHMRRLCSQTVRYTAIP